jgi:hypothetical protein
MDFEDEEEDGEETEKAKEEFMDMCLKIARNDASFVNLDDWFQQERPGLKLGFHDASFLGSCLAGNTHIKGYTFGLPPSGPSDAIIRAENAVSDGILKSRLEDLRLVRPSKRLQKILFEDVNKRNGLPTSLNTLFVFNSTLEIKAMANRLLRQPKLSGQLLATNANNNEHCHLLSHLTLQRCTLNDTDMLTISLALVDNHSLLTLRITQSSITDVGVKYFCQHWNTRSCLREIDMSANKIGASGAILLLTTITQRPSVKAFLLNCNETIGHSGIRRMGELLPHVGLTQLELYKCILTPTSYTKSSQESKDAARSLAIGLRGNTTLEWLHIGGNNLGSLGAKLIMQAAAGHPTLQRLFLSNDESIGLKGLKHIANQLPRTKLVFLRLNNVVTPWPMPQTKLAREAGQALLTAVQNSPHLVELEFQSLIPMWMAPIQVLIDLNKTCRPLLSNTASAPPSLWPHILANFGGRGLTSYLFFCLREQPWLVVARPRNP